MCYDEWKQQHPETPDDVFEGHWKALSRKDKGVSEPFSLLILSILTLRYPDQRYTSLAKKAVRYSYNHYCYLLLKSCFYRDRVLGRTRPPKASTAFSVFRVGGPAARQEKPWRAQVV